MNGANLCLQSVPVLFCKCTNHMDGSRNGNIFLTATVFVMYCSVLHGQVPMYLISRGQYSSFYTNVWNLYPG